MVSSLRLYKTWDGAQHFIQDCMCIRAVVSEQSSQHTLWVAKDLKRVKADSETSDQRALGACNFVGNVVPRLIFYKYVEV